MAGEIEVAEEDWYKGFVQFPSPYNFIFLLLFATVQFPTHISAEFSLKAFANGLLVILSCVTSSF